MSTYYEDIRGVKDLDLPWKTLADEYFDCRRYGINRESIGGCTDVVAAQKLSSLCRST